VDLDSVADELYALPVDEFIPTRTARVKEARAAKDRDLAAAIGALRKPSTSAWVVNLLARERADLVDQLLELAEALRSAQDTLSGPELRALSTQRHRVVASIVGEARKLAARQGVRVSDSVERELEATFDAALADPTAADAVRSGRLESSLSYAGLGAAPAGGAAPAAQARPKPAATKSARPKADDDAERREQQRRAEERRRAEEALRTAETAASEAESELTEARAAHEQATAARDEAEQHVADLTAELEQAQADLTARSSQVRDRKRAVQRAEQHAQEAHRRVERAQSALR
jgi:hypothetical protein